MRRSSMKAAAVCTMSAALLVGGLAPTVMMSQALAAEGDESVSTSNERMPRNTPGADGLPWLTEAGQDIKGYRVSAYEGSYYDERFEQYRLCVVQRESGGNYDESSGGFVGAYQMGSYNSPSRVTGKLRAEMVAEYGQDASKELDRLAAQPLYKWNRFWQDAAFWTIFNKGAGWRQWSAEWGANWNCDHRANAESGWPNKSRYNYTPIERSTASESTASTRSSKALRGTRHKAVERRFGQTKHEVGSADYSQWLARKFINAEYNWKSREFRALKSMWWEESNWRFEVVNWQGPWYGLGQVNGPFIESTGFKISQYRSSPYVQIKVGAAYIKQRYGSPKAAWQFWKANGWY